MKSVEAIKCKMHDMKVYILLLSFSILTCCGFGSPLEGFGLISRGETIKVTTCNLWNIMFNWEIRRIRIAQMIKKEQPDVIGFQEVRGGAKGDSIQNQIDDLQQFLPQYRWSYFLAINKVSLLESVYKKGFELEGLGILSRHQIVNVATQNLTYTYGPDTNRRAVLHVRILVQGFGELNVAVVHFSYDRKQQCGNAMELLHYVNEGNLSDTVLLGDFNTYNDFDLPIEILGKSKSITDSACVHQTKAKYAQKYSILMSDAWTMLKPAEDGLTFSNMPIPGLESRPDRVLVSNSYKTVSATLTGDGSVYKSRFFFHIVWQRFENVLTAMYDGFVGEGGRACIHDCGPHASCRCGVCVSGGDNKACTIPDCKECDPGTFKILLVILVCFSVLAAQLLYSVLLVLLVLNARAAKRDITTQWCGNCCLCDPELYTSMSKTIRRRTRQSVLWKIWPLLRLPPMVLVFVTALLIFVFMEISLVLFQGILEDVYAILPEELYPSDHLMLSVEIRKIKIN